MIEVTNPIVIKATLKIVQKRDKNDFEAELHDCVNMIRASAVCFDKVDIKAMISNWGMIHSDKQKEALLSNKYLLKFKSDVENTFLDFDITPDEFFKIIKESSESK